MEKLTNALIYRQHDGASEILVDEGVIRQVDKNANHTCSFGSADNACAFRMMSLFQRPGMSFVSLPTENARLQGRQDTYPKRRGLTRVKELWESGIAVCFGQDSINDRGIRSATATYEHSG